MLAQRLAGRHAGVSEDVVLALDRVGQGGEKGNLLREGVEEPPFERREIRDREGIDAQLAAHLPDQAALLVLDIGKEVPVLRVAAVVEDARPAVAVAADAEDVSLPAHCHHAPQQRKALRALLEQVAVEDQKIPVGEPDLRKQPLEVGEVAVNVGHDQHAPPGRQGKTLNMRPVRHRAALPASSQAAADRPCRPRARAG